MLYAQKRANLFGSPVYWLNYTKTILSVCCVRKDSDLARTLNRDCKLPLMLCAGSRNTAGKDLCSFRSVSSEFRRVFIIDMIAFIHAKLANFSAALFLRRPCYKPLSVFLLKMVNRRHHQQFPQNRCYPPRRNSERAGCKRDLWSRFLPLSRKRKRCLQQPETISFIAVPIRIIIRLDRAFNSDH